MRVGWAWQQLNETIDGVAFDKAAEDIGESSLRIEAVEFAGLDE
jgi:hypothetical protein